MQRSRLRDFPHTKISLAHLRGDAAEQVERLVAHNDLIGSPEGRRSGAGWETCRTQRSYWLTWGEMQRSRLRDLSHTKISLAHLRGDAAEQVERLVAHNDLIGSPEGRCSGAGWETFRTQRSHWLTWGETQRSRLRDLSHTTILLAHLRGDAAEQVERLSAHKDLIGSPEGRRSGAGWDFPHTKISLAHLRGDAAEQVERLVAHKDLVGSPEARRSGAGWETCRTQRSYWLTWGETQRSRLRDLSHTTILLAHLRGDAAEQVERLSAHKDLIGSPEGRRSAAGWETCRTQRSHWLTWGETQRSRLRDFPHTKISLAHLRGDASELRDLSHTKISLAHLRGDAAEQVERLSAHKDLIGSPEGRRSGAGWETCRTQRSYWLTWGETQRSRLRDLLHTTILLAHLRGDAAEQVERLVAHKDLIGSPEGRRSGAGWETCRTQRSYWLTWGEMQRSRLRDFPHTKISLAHLRGDAAEQVERLVAHNDLIGSPEGRRSGAGWETFRTQRSHWLTWGETQRSRLRLSAHKDLIGSPEGRRSGAGWETCRTQRSRWLTWGETQRSRLRDLSHTTSYWLTWGETQRSRLRDLSHTTILLAHLRGDAAEQVERLSAHKDLIGSPEGRRSGAGWETCRTQRSYWLTWGETQRSRLRDFPHTKISLAHLRGDAAEQVERLVAHKDLIGSPEGRRSGAGWETCRTQRSRWLTWGETQRSRLRLSTHKDLIGSPEGRRSGAGWETCRTQRSYWLTWGEMQRSRLRDLSHTKISLAHLRGDAAEQVERLSAHKDLVGSPEGRRIRAGWETCRTQRSHWLTCAAEQVERLVAHNDLIGSPEGRCSGAGWETCRTQRSRWLTWGETQRSRLRDFPHTKISLAHLRGDAAEQVERLSTHKDLVGSPEGRRIRAAWETCRTQRSHWLTWGETHQSSLRDFPHTKISLAHLRGDAAEQVERLSTHKDLVGEIAEECRRGPAGLTAHTQSVAVRPVVAVCTAHSPQSTDERGACIH